MSDTVTLYTNPYSRGRIVHLFLEVAAIPYEVELLDFATGDHKKPAFLAKNPMGKLPVVSYRGTVVSETAAIITWLADLFPERGLLPSVDDPARGIVLKWLYFGAGCVEPATTDKAFNRPPVGKGSVGWGTYDDVVNTLLVGLRPGPFFLGDRLSVADLYVGSQIAWGLHQKTLEPHPELLRIVEELKALPAQARVQEQTIAMVAELDRRKPKT
jgi:glutathione S-transferase